MKEPKFKFPSGTLTPEDIKESAIRRVCGAHSLTLAREIVWAHEAVDIVGLSDYTFMMGSLITDLEKLKLRLWDSKVSEHIAYRHLQFRREYEIFNALWPTFKSEFEQEQKELLSKIVAHVMINGNDAPKPPENITQIYELLQQGRIQLSEAVDLLSKT